MLGRGANRLEEFLIWDLPLNGYFIVPNFAVHAGGDPTLETGIPELLDRLAWRTPRARTGMKGTFHGYRSVCLRLRRMSPWARAALRQACDDEGEDVVSSERVGVLSRI